MLCGWRVLRVQCLLISFRREKIKIVCAQWPVTRCAKLRLITINNNQLNVTISITVIINSWWDCFWLGKQVILSLAIPRVSSAPSGYYQCQCWFPFLIFIATLEELKLRIVCMKCKYINVAALLKIIWRQSPLVSIWPNRYKWMVIFTSIGSTGAVLRKW